MKPRTLKPGYGYHENGNRDRPRKATELGERVRADIDWGIGASEWPRARDKWKKIKRKVKSCAVLTCNVPPKHLH
jgi:hypothetical protein